MEHIAVSRDGHVLVIRIDRPEKLNALTPAMYHALGAALHQLNEDRELRVAVVHGEGRHFTSGLQLDLWSDAFASGTPLISAAVARWISSPAAKISSIRWSRARLATIRSSIWE